MHIHKQAKIEANDDGWLLSIVLIISRLPRSSKVVAITIINNKQQGQEFFIKK
jgi:hypothetical protein